MTTNSGYFQHQGHAASADQYLDAAIRTDQEVVFVVIAKCERVVVDVLRVMDKWIKCVAAVARLVQLRIHLVHVAFAMRIGKQLLVVVRTCRTGQVVILLFPVRAGQ